MVTGVVLSIIGDLCCLKQVARWANTWAKGDLTTTTAVFCEPDRASAMTCGEHFIATQLGDWLWIAGPQSTWVDHTPLAVPYHGQPEQAWYTWRSVSSFGTVEYSSARFSEVEQAQELCLSAHDSLWPSEMAWFKIHSLFVTCLLPE